MKTCEEHPSPAPSEASRFACVEVPCIAAASRWQIRATTVVRTLHGSTGTGVEPQVQTPGFLNHGGTPKKSSFFS